MKKTKQLGISLLEVLLSLSIIAIILVMATRYYFVASNNNKINTTVSQVGGVLAAAQNWKGVETDYTGISVQELYNAGQLINYPGLRISGDTATLNDMWGKAITIAADSSNAKISVILPSPNICAALVKAYPENSNAGITSACDGNTFNYTFS